MSEIYHEAASVLADMDVSQRGFRDVFYSRAQLRKCSTVVNKQVYALVSKVLVDYSMINEILSASQLLESFPHASATEQVSTWSKRNCLKRVKALRNGSSKVRLQEAVQRCLWCVMAWDLLFGKGLRSGGPIASVLRKNRGMLMRLKDVHAENRNQHNKKDPLPRYLRVNTQRIELRDALNQLTQFISDEIHDQDDRKPQLSIDPVVPNLLRMDGVCHIDAVTQHNLLQNGSLVFQDRASCLSTVVADVKPGMCILDACAAPGSKTLHCIDMLRGKGRVIAVEKDIRRAATLIKRIKLCTSLCGPFLCLGCSASAENAIMKQIPVPLKGPQGQTGKIFLQKCDSTSSITNPPHSLQSCFFRDASFNLIVEVIVGDFLDVKPTNARSSCLCEACLKQNVKLETVNESPPIDVVLVDPSCSGTGLPLHTTLVHNDAGGERIQKLAAFQRRVLSHALSQFPTAKCVCYSTCSVDVRENEMVVSAVLDKLSTEREYVVVDIKDKCWRRNSDDQEACKYLAGVQKEHMPQLSIFYQQCFHSHPDADDCRGFFLAKLVPRNLVSK